MNISNLNKAYIAGFIDGEGCISITKRKDKEYKNGYSFYSNIRITNTNLEILEWIKNILDCGGHLKACIIAKELLPFLIVKKKQAEILLDFQKLKEENKQKGIDGVPPERWKKQVILCEQIQKLNQRGVKMSRGEQSLQSMTLTKSEAEQLNKSLKSGSAKPKIKILNVK